ncbi:ABC transporter permease [Mangrovicoccus algicola]|uniref:ABC transporter permease n=1 Tax=Mangrovicoccus algicola TaxID=2771008 RepID=A0A8J7CJ44_9RHOB|nr:ABC transporter permease [Mangrovicoccus algicola]MBE3637261.1 ABC transporter permease [Mangrovicoccus algicola]
MTAETLSGWRAGIARMRFPRSSFLEAFSIGFLILLVALAVLADWIPGLVNPNFPYGDFSAPPDLTLNGLFGTDALGRSILSRVIYGARQTLVIVILATAISMTGGLILGMIAGYCRGMAERTVDLLANTMAVLPPVLIILALVSVTGTSVVTMTLTLGILDIGTYARLTKGGVISQNQRDYVLAARALGAGHGRILFREILPNLVPTMTAVVPPLMAGLIITEGSLSFLGFGIPAPAPSWGGMIAASTDLISRFPLLIFGPILAIVLTVYALNTTGDFLARRIDIRERQI